ncbi:MAG: sensor histidine kinase [Clostridiales bacterium]|nr:sensor histidine kinase [Clostridiales bacterium]
MSFFKKMTLVYIIAIIIPTFAIGGLYYYHSQRYIENEVVKTVSGLVSQTKDGIVNKFNIAENVGEQIAYNSRLQRFLSRQFIFKPNAFEEYIDFIYPFINNALNFNQINIYNISIFVTNASIPESWSRFYHVSRIEEQSWYKDFVESDSNYMWMYRDIADLFKTHRNVDHSKVFTYVRKLYSLNNKYLGIAVIDIKVDDLLSALRSSYNGQWLAYLLDSGTILLPDDQADEDVKLVDINAKQSVGHFVNEDKLYLYQKLEEYDLMLVHKVSMKALIQSSRTGNINIILSVVFGILLLVIATYLILNILFSKIRQIIHVMNEVARGNFNIRIPVEGNNEIGQIANDFNTLIERVNNLVDNLIKKEIAQREAQLKALQYQINPHFIYNTIDSFRMKMVLIGEYETAEVITDFGKMLRYNMTGESMHTTIAEEVEYVKKFLNLQKFRYGERISLNIELPVELKRAKILRFILQPIVENSLSHGLTGIDQKVNIDIFFQLKNNMIAITVQDDGVGIDPVRLEEIKRQLYAQTEYNEVVHKDDSGSIGLININQRLKLYYGEQYSIQIESKVNEYTKTVISIPYQEIDE